MKIRIFGFAVWSLLGSLIAGCATTAPIVSQWRNPAYASASFSKIMIAALGGTASTRRNFEDQFSAQLRAVGVEGLVSYGYLFEGTDTDENAIKAAAQKAGVDALIVARLVRVEEKTQYGGPYLPYTSFGVFGSNVGASVSGLGGAPTAYHYTEYTAETTLHDAVRNEVVWTATTTTSEPASGGDAIKSTVAAVVKTLVEENLLPQRR